MLLEIKIAKLNTTRSFNWDELPESSRRYLASYGLTQRLNDKHASIKRDDYDTESEWLADVTEAVDVADEQIRSGNIPGSRAPADPDAKLVREVLAQLKAAGGEVDVATVLAETKKAKKAKAA